jgi:hypothetical protein
MAAFILHLKSCLPSAIRSLILPKKAYIRNTSGMAGGKWRGQMFFKFMEILTA